MAAKIGQHVQFVYAAREHDDAQVFAAVITDVHDQGVSLTYFPPGGGSIGRVQVFNVSEAANDADYWRAIPR